MVVLERLFVRDRLAVKEFRGNESLVYIRDEFVRVGSLKMYENRLRGIGYERRRVEKVE